MATTKAAKPITKPTAKTVEKKGCYYSFTRHVSGSEYIGLEDNDLFGPFASVEDCIEDAKGCMRDNGNEEDSIIIVEGVCLVNLKEKREIIVEKKPL